MTKTMAVADLHGRFDLLTEVLKHDTDKVDRIVFLGDYIDRGPHSKQVLERLYAMKYANPERYVMLKGNHEDMMVQVMQDPSKIMWWIQNGGEQTIESFGISFDDVNMTEEQIVNTLAVMTERVNDLPTILVDDHRVFVHAAYGHNDQERMWHRYTSRDDGPYYGNDGVQRHVVHGHTPQKTIFQGQYRTNLDLGSYHYGKVGVAIFDDEIAGPPIELIEVSV